MTLFAHLASLGWIPFILVLFAFVPARRAVLVAYIGGFLFLPNSSYDLTGLPDFTKTMASSLAALLGVGLFNPQALLAFRLRWFDWPMLVFCVSPIVTSVLNGLGLYDGLSRLLDQMIAWGVPYLMGRIYFFSRKGMYELAVGLFIGGLIYVPLCLWEIRMSPNLHYQLYGFRQRTFGAGVRYGGYRPSVFAWSYIPVANWLAMSTVAGFWLWRSGRLRRIFGVSTLLPLAVLFVTLLLTKTLGALVLLSVAGFVLLSREALRRPTALAIVVLVVPLLIGARATGVFKGDLLVGAVRVISAERAHSFAYRLNNENLLAEKALRRPLFGWGGFGRSRVYDEMGDDVTITDGLWIITLGKAGLVGLSALLSIFVVALVRFDRRFPGRSWRRPEVAPGAVAAAVLAMALVNNVPNVTANPVVPIAAGAVATFGGRRLVRNRRPELESPPADQPSLGRELLGRRTAGPSVDRAGGETRPTRR